MTSATGEAWTTTETGGVTLTAGGTGAVMARTVVEACLSHCGCGRLSASAASCRCVRFGNVVDLCLLAVRSGGSYSRHLSEFNGFSLSLALV